MNPQAQYQAHLQAGLITPDAQQRHVVAQFERLHVRLRQRAQPQSWLATMLQHLRWPPLPAEGPVGIYLWGGVGRGKTYLMDLFYDAIHSDDKLRTHFHRFMQRVHQSLTHYQGRKNPLQDVADEIADQASLVCFDEFFVLDIGDAMILAGLLEALFARGVVLVATSNIHPDGLYENGLQRERFLPAIGLLKQYTNVIELEAGTDYRLRSLSQATLYHHPINSTTESSLHSSFHDLAPDQLELQEDYTLTILGREIPCRCSAGDVAWFEFAALCDGPRSAFDYVEIARLFHALIVSNVPRLGDERSAQTRRFINLVDELYDRRVKLILSAEVALTDLYQGQTLAFEFSRTESRLLEMQSHDYLGSGHRA